MSPPSVDQKNGQSLRFASLIRVSTERQEKTGESLRIQASDNKASVERLDGKIVAHYGGQEHSTPGFEKKEMDRLIADAGKGIFDAVIVAHEDRWSRDNAKSKEGFAAFRKHKIRFFIGTQEKNLYNPTDKFQLGMSAEVGELHAGTQNKKSIEARIERAERGVPTAGRLPIGRSFDKKTETWGIDKEVQSKYKSIAKRYLTGEPLARIAKEYGENHSAVHRNLTQCCGPEFAIHFDSDELNIHEVVTIKIPELLPAPTIKAILKKCEANKTYSRGSQKNPWLLGHFVFCEHCGYTLYGQLNSVGKRYYRHGNVERVRPCPRPKGGSFISADVLEENFIRQLFELFGDPKAVAWAIEAATPNPEQNSERKMEREVVLKRLAENTTAKDRIVGFAADGTLSRDEIVARMDKLRQTEANLEQRLVTLNTQLENVPDPDAVRELAKKIARNYSNAKINAKYSHHSNLSWKEQRQLIELVFGGMTPDGKRMGIYIRWKEGKQRTRKWSYSIVGTINETKLIPRSLAALKKLDEIDDSDENVVVGHSASHSRALGPHARRSPSPAARSLRGSKRSPAASAPPSTALW